MDESGKESGVAAVPGRGHKDPELMEHSAMKLGHLLRDNSHQAALDKHVYLSKFAVGDKVMVNGRDLTGGKEVSGVVHDLAWAADRPEECSRVQVLWTEGDASRVGWVLPEQIGPAGSD